MRTNLPRAIVHLRHRRGWRQSDLSRRAGVSRPVISRIEHGDLSGLSVRSVRRVVGALDASVELIVRWQGEQLDRLIDADHARIVQGIVRLLEALGWMTRVEVSFNHYGDRGRVDVLAMHAPSRTLLVAEAKSAVGDTQDTVGRLDVKVRLGRMLASSVSWEEPIRIVPALVIADTRASRRVVAEHDGVFRRFNVRGRVALAWLRRPTSAQPTGALWFAKLPNARGADVKQRVRVQKGRRQS
jgi:transcriptional regulator with XRE-family HTH domain